MIDLMMLLLMSVDCGMYGYRCRQDSELMVPTELNALASVQNLKP